MGDVGGDEKRWVVMGLRVGDGGEIDSDGGEGWWLGGVMEWWWELEVIKGLIFYDNGYKDWWVVMGVMGGDGMKGSDEVIVEDGE